MGMYDEVTCEYALPDGYDAQDIVFQTKDLDNALERYTITAAGRLMRHRIRCECIDTNHEPATETIAEAPASFLDTLPKFNSVFNGFEDAEFHGDLHIYYSNIAMAGPEGFATRDDAPLDSREYTIRFTNGCVERVYGGRRWDEARVHRTRAELDRLWKERGDREARHPQWRARANRNQVVSTQWSNHTSEALYNARWPDEPELAEQCDEGKQCLSCPYYVPFNTDWGLCASAVSRHYLETVFEHFTCDQFTEGEPSPADLVPRDQL